jgi:hypothetical protein
MAQRGAIATFGLLAALTSACSDSVEFIDQPGTGANTSDTSNTNVAPQPLPKPWRETSEAVHVDPLPWG